MLIFHRFSIARLISLDHVPKALRDPLMIIARLFALSHQPSITFQGAGAFTLTLTVISTSSCTTILTISERCGAIARPEVLTGLFIISTYLFSRSAHMGYQENALFVFADETASQTSGIVL
jgi:hypothetical protein